MVRIDPAGVIRGSRVSRLAAIPLHPFLIGAFFILHVLTGNLGERVPPTDVLEVLAVTVGGTGALFAGLSLVTHQPRLAGLLTSITVVWVFALGEVRAVLNGPPQLRVWIAVGVVAIGLAWIFRHRLVVATTPLNIISASLVAVTVGTLAPHYIAAAFTSPYFSPMTPLGTLAADGRRPDIYYIILDRYPSATTLESAAYRYDNSAFIDELGRRGFFVASNSYANYTSTAQSLASSLNMDYLDVDAMAAAATDGRDWGPVFDMLAGRLAAPTLLEELGYSYVQLPSWFYPTAAGVEVDHRLEAPTLSAFAEAVHQSTAVPSILQAAGIDPVHNHAAYALFQFEQLAAMEPQGSPRFVFAHVLLPHPPIVFGPDGLLPRTEHAYGDGVPPEKFVGQLEYTNGRVLEVLDHLLAPPSGDDPIVIIQADEGPYPPIPVTDWRHAEQEYQRKFGILNAYYMPGVRDSGLYPAVSPVNTFRVIFNAYFDATLPMLDDRAYVYRDSAHIYDNFDITDQLSGGATPP